MPDDLVIPAAIETVIQRFENATSPFTELDVWTALGEARRSLQSPSEEESFAAWAEVLGFALQADRTGKSPWRTFFGPTGSSTREDGKPIYYPDIVDADLVKAVHVLVPQVEKGLRSIVGHFGKPVTKPHSTVADVGVAIGMGDILYSEELTEALGPDITLYFLALYADPRGRNLRNRVARGLLTPEFCDGNLVLWLIHTLLVFGLWKELAAERR
jgi:Domain of unknown function (DUF4209)